VTKDIDPDVIEALKTVDNGIDPDEVFDEINPEDAPNSSY